MSEEKFTGGFRSLGEFLVATRKFLDGETRDGRIDELFRKTMSEGTDSAGGVLVPEKWADQILSVALENSIVRSRAIRIPGNSDTLNIRVLVDSDRSSNIFGGITMTWLEEAGDKAANVSDPSLGNLKLTAHEGVVGAFVSNSLENDVEKFEQFFLQAFGRAIRFYEDETYIWGTGSGQPLGIMNSGAMIPVTRTANSKVDLADIGNMAERLLPGSWQTAVWLVNQSVLSELIELTANAANSASVIDLAKMQILGRPIIVTEKCSAMGTTGDIILADFGQYVIFDRELIVASSRHVNYGGSYGFLQNETFWKIVLRVDGQPVPQEPITPRRGGSTVSPFVCLTTSS